ncbi:hypothetical protein NEOLI_005196 [Neolecta irregularis DAH-3]|uniref:Peptidase A2 domain-containing protein n=1 Tax=Neolecta irregularis (strain DAH-3) TaxID=1198029 RepID=A0A1U7LLB3_NEOID|nr:hypothetical protein NEOLI_005196 [Neolecta irregularis DAH-3]|eukprot:OLL23444.1 hypothetical protein NEOLI_005196 [Neolecta irregularis DAH-3]
MEEVKMDIVWAKLEERSTKQETPKVPPTGSRDTPLATSRRIKPEHQDLAEQVKALSIAFKNLTENQNQPSNRTWQPRNQNLPIKCIWCDEGHMQRECQELQEALTEGKVQKINNRICDIEGKELRPQWNRGGMRTLPEISNLIRVQHPRSNAVTLEPNSDWEDEDDSDSDSANNEDEYNSYMAQQQQYFRKPVWVMADKRKATNDYEWEIPQKKEKIHQQIQPLPVELQSEDEEQIDIQQTVQQQPITQQPVIQQPIKQQPVKQVQYKQPVVEVITEKARTPPAATLKPPRKPKKPDHQSSIWEKAKPIEFKEDKKTTTKEKTEEGIKYQVRAPIMGQTTADEFSKEVFNTQITTSIGKLLALSPDLRKVIAGQVQGKRQIMESRWITNEEELLFEEYKEPTVEKPFYSVASPEAKVQIMGQHITAIFDSGSEISLMPFRMVKRLGLMMDDQPAWQIGVADGSNSRLVGVCHDVPVKTGGFSIPTNIFVTKHAKYDLLLGRPYERSGQMKSENTAEGETWITIKDPEGYQRVKFRATAANNERNRAWINRVEVKEVLTTCHAILEEAEHSYTQEYSLYKKQEKRIKPANIGYQRGKIKKKLKQYPIPIKRKRN